MWYVEKYTQVMKQNPESLFYSFARIFHLERKASAKYSEICFTTKHCEMISCPEIALSNKFICSG